MLIPLAISVVITDVRQRFQTHSSLLGDLLWLYIKDVVVWLMSINDGTTDFKDKALLL